MASDLSAALHKLHQLLIQLEDADRLLSQGPRRIAAAERSLQVVKDAIEVQKQEIKARRKIADEGNLKLRSKEAELLKLEGMLNQASSNKEYDIVKGQIASANAERLRMEDSVLAAMDDVDSCQKRLAEMETELRQQGAHLEQTRAEVEASEPETRRLVADIGRQVEEAEKSISWGECAAAYQRLRSAHGAAALAAVEELCCTACSNRLTTQDLVRINTGNMIPCRECGRIVYVV